VTFTVSAGGQSFDPATGKGTFHFTVEFQQPAPEPPPAARLLPGVSAARPGVSPLVEFKRLQSLFGGGLAVRRGFSTMFPASWALHTSSRDPGLGAAMSVSSVKSNPVDMATGASDALVAGFVRSIPDGWPVVLIWQHEPEDPQKGFDPAVYRKAAARFASAVRAALRPGQRIRVGWCLMGWSFTPGSGRNPLAWWPGDAAVDVVCADPYSFRETSFVPFTHDSVGAVAAHRFAVEHGKAFGVAEWGCYDLPATRRPDFIRSGDEWLRSVGAEFACWFHHNLSNAPSLAPTTSCLIDSSPASVAAFGAHVAGV
jgi:hypothetical protein